MDKPGLRLIEMLSPRIVEHWREMRDQHPEQDDLVAEVEHHDGGGFGLTIGPREAFVAHMRSLGRWTEGSAWDELLVPASDGKRMPRASVLWVVLHLPDNQSAIMRMVNPPIISRGGDA